MEYLNPKTQQRRKIFLWLGYSLIALGIAIGCVILLWEAYGYNVENGKIIQDGMAFISSQPNPASIYLNNTLNPATTNTRLTIPAGVYNLEIKLSGYRSWKHILPVLGGGVVHFDYPLLFPTKLTSKTISTLTGVPEIASQSPSLQYLLVSSPSNFNDFYLYNLSAPNTPAVTLSLPAGLLSAATTSQSWQVVGWANDNQHILLEHLFDGSDEFIELDTQNPAQSININREFNISPSSVSFVNLQYNDFYFYNSANEILSQGSIGNPITQVATGILSFKSYLSNVILYATTTGAPHGDVAIDLNVSGSTYFVRDLPLASTYLLNMAGYNGNEYAVVGDSSYDFVDIYENPIDQATNTSKIVPYIALNISNPNYESFAPTAQFIMVENGNIFAIYDILNNVTYHYTTSLPIESPQFHAQWMDGDRLVYVSSGKITVADFDNTNRQTLTSSLPQFNTFFAPDYHSYFTLNDSGSGVALEQTSLIIP